MSYLPFEIDDHSYQSMLRCLNGLQQTDGPGENIDHSFLQRDEWLSDCAVMERIVRRHGQLEIHLVFAYQPAPIKFISRFITTSNHPRRAAVMASLMRRQAAKDQRGTISVDHASWTLAPN